MLQKTVLTLALAAGLAAPLVSPAQAQIPVPIPVVGVPPLLFMFGGHDWCWYDDGWKGAGWYWCGYGYRQGFGWGGPEGFHGWTQHRYERDWHPKGGHGPGPRPKPHAKKDERH